MNPPTPTESPESPAITIGSRVRVKADAQAVSRFDRIPHFAGKDGIVKRRATDACWSVEIEGESSTFTADELELLPAEESPDDLRAQAENYESWACDCSAEERPAIKRKAAELRARADEMEREKPKCGPSKYKSDNRPARGGWAPGRYLCKCHQCESRFFGDKRSAACADCAYAEPAQPKQGPTKGEFTYGMAEEAEAVYSETGLTPRQLAEAGKWAIARFAKLEAETAALTQERDQLKAERDELLANFREASAALGKAKEERQEKIAAAFHAEQQRDELAKALEEFVETRNDIDDDTMEQWAVMVDESAPISQAEAERHVAARVALAKIIPK